MIKLLSKSLVLIFLFITSSSDAKEEILFTVNNNPVTSIDLDQRIYYLNFFNDFDINNIDKNRFIEDLISIKIFNEYAERKRVEIQEDNIKKFFNEILKNNKKKLEYLLKNKELTEEIILENIKYDLQRDKIIDYYLNDRISKTNLTNNNYNIINIFNIKLNYFIIDNKYEEKIKKISNELLKKEISIIKESLDNLKINYDFFSGEVTNIDRINNKIKTIILNNENVFFINQNDYMLIGTIEKNLKDDIDLEYSFFQIKTKKNMDFNIIINEPINCSDIDNKKSDNRLEITEYKEIDLKNLNMTIFKNLSETNERLIIQNNDQKFLILLCNINYNKKIAQNKLMNNEIKKHAKEIEAEFIKTKKKEFNFQKFY